MKDLLKQLGFTERVDENGRVLKEPTLYDPRSKTGNTKAEHFDKAEAEYNQAKEKVYLPPLSSFESKAYKKWKINGRTDVTFLDNYQKAVHGYTDFITQPLTKGMFVPCDEEWSVLEDTEEFGGSSFENTNKMFDKAEQYQKALDRVLFEGLQHPPYYPNITNAYGYLKNNGYETIEQAINNNVKLYLK